MNGITDDDLTLLYYGEHEDPGLAARVAASPELSSRFDALCAELGQVDSFAPPERGDDYGADVWRRISPRLEAEAVKPGAILDSWLGSRLGEWLTEKRDSFFGQPRFSLAGALSLVLVATLAFMLGRQGGQPADSASIRPDAPPAAAMVEMDGGRLLTSSVSGHLEQLNLLLTQFANTPQTSAAEAGLATDMLVANRLYRRSALSRGDHRLAAVLEEIEPLLIELAHEAHRNSPETRNRMQREVTDSLLFRVRIMNSQLDQSNVSI